VRFISDLSERSARSCNPLVTPSTLTSDCSTASKRVGLARGRCHIRGLRIGFCSATTPKVLNLAGALQDSVREKPRLAARRQQTLRVRATRRWPAKIAPAVRPQHLVHRRGGTPVHAPHGEINRCQVRAHVQASSSPSVQNIILAHSITSVYLAALTCSHRCSPPYNILGTAGAMHRGA